MPERMISRPNSFVDVFRDADEATPVVDRDRDDYGDEVETPRDDTPGGSTNEPYLSAEPALIVSEIVSAAVDGNLRTIRRPIARMRPDIDVQAGDRLVDTFGAVYSVESVERPRFSPTRLLDVRLELTRTT